MMASSATVSSAAPVARGAEFASAAKTCAVLQAAYTAALGRDAPAYPRDVRPSGRSRGSVTDIVPESRDRLGLSADEVADLATRQEIYRSDAFRPVCAWKGRTGPARDDEGHAVFVTFTSPILSTSGRLALTEVAFRETGIFGYGLLCTARLSHMTWTARCMRSWTN
jgi:hypothetical protein